MMKILYFDCFAGISGDMTIGALLDLGVKHELFLEEINKLKLDGFKIEIKKKTSNSIQGTDFSVIMNNDKKEHSHEHRNLDDITKIINSSNLNDNAKKISLSIFSKIAIAESEVHGVPVEEIHFHEVGAIDSIVDIVGTAVCIDILRPDKIVSSPLHLGTGTIKCAHGILPIPAPATVKILKDVPVYSTGVKGELVTPTGAGIIKTLTNEFSNLPQMKIDKTGYGTGKRDYGVTNGITNVLRVILGNAGDVSENLYKKVPNSKAETLVMLETNIDDMNPEFFSYIVPKSLEQGALDVFMTNIIMKKGRPGTILNVLCKETDTEKFYNFILNETSTFGVRVYPLERYCIDRKIITIDTQYGKVNVKAGLKDGKIIKISPEYEECRRIAEKNNVPLQVVYKKVSEQAVRELL